MPKKQTTAEFILKARQAHGWRYNYSKVEYVNNKTKVCIICPEHGEFFQLPKDHLKGVGCHKCAISKKTMTKEEFIQKANLVHGRKYDYSKVIFKNTRTKVCIICPKHGEFWQTPHSHLNGRGCKKCGIDDGILKTKLGHETFVERANLVHKNKYDYTKVNYVNSYTNVQIICPEHGEFSKTPQNHLRGQGCPKCSANAVQSKAVISWTNRFLDKAREIHGNKYDYSKTIYKNSYTPVCIVCKEHGEFLQEPHIHLKGSGCPKCAITKSARTKEEFIEKAIAMHGDKYDYSKVDYINGDIKVCIICPKHGEFWQTPSCHLQGVGCPRCHSSKLESKISVALQENLLNFEQEKSVNSIIGIAPSICQQRVDFYLMDTNICIECQGAQHFIPVNFNSKFSEEDVLQKYNKQIKLDNSKYELLTRAGYDVIYFAEKDFEKYCKDGWYSDKKVFYDIESVIDYIKEKENELICNRR